jgi:hypothetical protein
MAIGKMDRTTEVSDKVPSWVKLQKWLVLTGFLALVLIFFGVFFVWLQNEQVQYGYRIANLEREYKQGLALHRKLHLEWIRLHEPAYLENLALKELGLVPPPQGQEIFIKP